MVILGLLPVAVLLLVAVVLHLRGGPNGDFRRAILLSSLICGGWLVLGTEILSLCGAIGFRGILILWLAPAIAAMAAVGMSWRRDAKLSIVSLWPQGDLFTWLCLIVVAVLSLTILVLCVVAPPNTWDVMTYHLPRVTHWLQNRSVAHFPTHNLRQLFQPPLAEFAQMHVMVLSGGDRLVNLVQWFTMVGSLLAVSLLAKELGLGGRGQVLSVVFTATLSMGILQASSGQNDYVLAYWLTLFSYFALAAGKELNWQNTAAAGLALGLAILTKATAYVIGLPFLVCLSISSFRRMGWRAIGPMGAIALAVCFVNAGHWYRNTMLLGDPLGARGAGLSAGEYKISNDTHTPGAVLSVALRNAALQLGSTNSLWNDLLFTVIFKIHEGLGMDINDPATTYGGESGRKLGIGFVRDESLASDPLHFVILLVAAGWLLTQKAQPIRWQLWLTLLAALVFCVYLKWQIWHARLHLPLFLLLAPLAGHFLSQCRPAAAWIVAAAMLLQAGPDALFATSRPLAPTGEKGSVSVFRRTRNQLYFTQNSTLYLSYMRGLAALDSLNVRQLGLIVGGGDPFEYPIWAMPPQGGPVTIRHVNVTNCSAGLREPNDDPPPDAVLVLGESEVSEIVVGETRFLPYFREKYCQVFLSADRIDALKQAAVTKPDLKGENPKSPE